METVSLKGPVQVQGNIGIIGETVTTISGTVDTDINGDLDIDGSVDASIYVPQPLKTYECGTKYGI